MADKTTKVPPPPTTEPPLAAPPAKTTVGSVKTKASVKKDNVTANGLTNTSLTPKKVASAAFDIAAYAEAYPSRWIARRGTQNIYATKKIVVFKESKKPQIY